MRIETVIKEDDPRMPATWRILSSMIRHPEMSQADLREWTGLSHPIIVQQVARLRQAQLICLGQPVNGRQGRPPTPMSFNWDYKRLLAAEVHRDGLTVLVTDLAGNPVADPHTTPITIWTRDGILQALIGAITTALALPSPGWAAIGVALPGTLVSEWGGNLDGQALAHSADELLASELTAHFDLPVLTLNVADALARAIWSEQLYPIDELVAISLRHNTSVEMGLVIDGNPVRSAAQRTGGIGYTRIPNSTTAANRRCESLDDLFTAMRVDATIRPQAMRALAEIIANMVIALGPQQLVIQADERWSSDDTLIVRDTLGERCYPGTVDERLLLDIRPYSAAESLQGVLSLLSSFALDLRKGPLSNWIADALVTDRNEISRLWGNERLGRQWAMR